MGKVLLILVLILVVVAALGFYLDWFHFQTDSESGKIKGTLEIDKNKIKEDAEKARQKLGGSGGTPAEKPSGQ
jgi:hypothetical protein